MGGEFGMYVCEESCIRFLVGELEGKIALVRSRHRWEDNIKMDLHEVGWGHGLD